jgi:hypothetical protein
MLSDEIKKLREGRITASMAPTIMEGKEDRLMELYLRLTGQAPELEQTWPMKLGSFLETFIIDHHETKTGLPLTERGTFVPHPTRDLVSSTLDCYRATDDTVIDAKVCNNHQPIDEIIKYYTGQVVVQQRCRGARNGALLIMHGLAEPKEYPIEWNPEYEAELWSRIEQFQRNLETWTPPSAMPAVVPPDQWRTIDLHEEYRSDWPNWGGDMVGMLQLWLEHQKSAAIFAAATKEAKQLLPDDVGRVEADGVLMLRNKAGAVTIKEARR